MSVSTTRASTGDAIPRQHVILAGGIAGLTARFVIAPLDVVKIRLQLQAHSTSDPLSRAGPGPVYKGTLNTLRRIARDEGITAWWKGNVPAEYLYLTYGAVQFVTYQQLSLQVLPPLGLPAAAVSFISGATAGAVATSATYPFDLLRTRLAAQGQARVYTSLAGSVRRIYEAEGSRGFFRGLGAGLAQIVPYMGLFFTLFNALKPAAEAAVPRLPAPARALGAPDAAAGVAASALAKAAVYPLDTVRKRLQVQGPDVGRYVHGSSIPAYGNAAGMLAMFRGILLNEGVRSLYRGLCVSILKAAPSSAVTIWTYERAISILGDLEERE